MAVEGIVAGGEISGGLAAVKPLHCHTAPLRRLNTATHGAIDTSEWVHVDFPYNGGVHVDSFFVPYDFKPNGGAGRWRCCNLLLITTNVL